MKQTQKTHARSLAAVAYSLAGGKAAAVTRASGEVAARSLAREGRRRLHSGRDIVKIVLRYIIIIIMYN